jgi:hypothetical protein
MKNSINKLDMLYKKIIFKKFNDGNGDLIPIELSKNNHDFPFDVKRIYFINDPKDSSRGNHAHFNLEQIIICCKGSFTLHLDDGLGKKEDIILNSNNEGIHIKGLKWRVLKDFSKDCIITVLASSSYDKNRYIKDYNEFLKIVKKTITI